MLVASLTLIAVLGAAVVVGLAFAEQRRLEQALEDVRLGDLKARTSHAEAERAADWLGPITDPIRPMPRLQPMPVERSAVG